MLNIYLPFLSIVRSIRSYGLILSVVCFLFQLPVYGDELVYRINSGGSSTSNSIGTFAADKYFSPAPGYTTSTTKAIANTSDDAMYQNQRGSTSNNGTFSYNLPVSSGQYRVKLYLAEIYWTSVGQRRFDLSAEGTKVLNDYDILRKVGPLTATTETFTVNVTDGTLNLYFSALASDNGVNRPQIGGLEVVKVTSSVQNFTQITWSTVASQPYVVNEAQGKVVNNKLYTFGGFDSRKSGYTPTNRAYVYSLSTNTWTALAPMPPMNGTNYGGVTHAGITTDGADIYLAGGYTSNAAGTGQIFGTKEVWKYLVAENRYVRLPDLPLVISAGQLEYLQGRLHYIGGTNQARTQDLATHFVLDLSNLSGGWKSLAALPNPRQHAGSAVYEGKIYYIGGQTGHDGKLVTQKYVHQYNPATNTWSRMADLPVPAGTNGRGHISSSVVVVGSRILVLGGETANSTGRTNMVSAYTPATNRWENLTPLPQTRYSGVAGFLANTLIYTGGSRTNITYKGVPVTAQQSATSNLQEALITSEPQGQEIKVYPNPSPKGNKIYVTVAGLISNEQTNIGVHNLAGVKLQTTTATADKYGNLKLEIPGTDRLPSGLYIVNVEGTQTKKKIKVVIE